ncbi:MAG: pilus assembly protein, partial [Rhodospirillales bacterium]|nr:pilus assembly protein [Rhodospirillales bacterium]
MTPANPATGERATEDRPTGDPALESRPDRPALIAFAADGQTEIALRDGLADALPEALDIRRGGIRAAIAAMQKNATPRVLIVDTGGQDEPLDALGALAEVTEPDVVVLVIGDAADLDIYRAVTRGLGAREYLPKPLTRDKVALHFAPIVSGQAVSEQSVLGSQVVTVTGARGGAGASTVALNLAWHFGVLARRHTVLLDPDLHMGVAAFLLNLRPGSGLRLALEAPERIDSLLAERAAIPAADRLHVLAAHEKLTTDLAYVPGTAAALLEALRRRYNFIIVDAPFRPQPLHRELLDLANQRVVVMEPTLASVRDALRLLALPASPVQARRAIVVLNRATSAGGITRRQVEEALGLSADVAIPNLPRQVSGAATLGEPAVGRHGGFRAAIAELARQAAPVRLADAPPLPAARPGFSLRRLLRRA